MSQMLEMPEDARPVTIGVRCRDCVHFHTVAMFSDGNGGKKPCHDLGRQERSFPCSHFSANPFGFQALKDPVLIKLYEILPKLNRKNVALLAALLSQESRTANQGFRFGEVVHVRLLPDDYLSNYFTARVIKADADYVYLQGGAAQGYHATVLRGSVLNRDEWEEKKAQLLASRRLVDPRAAEYFRDTPDRAKMTQADYEASPMESFRGAGLTSIADAPVREAGKRRPNAPRDAADSFAEGVKRLRNRRILTVAQG